MTMTDETAVPSLEESPQDEFFAAWSLGYNGQPLPKGVSSSFKRTYAAASKAREENDFWAGKSA